MITLKQACDHARIATQLPAVTDQEIMGSRRSKDIAKVRQTVCWILRCSTQMSLQQIADKVGLDHTTVMHAIDKVVTFAEQDDEFYERLKQSLRDLLELSTKAAKKRRERTKQIAMSFAGDSTGVQRPKPKAQLGPVDSDPSPTAGELSMAKHAVLESAAYYMIDPREVLARPGVARAFTPARNRAIRSMINDKRLDSRLVGKLCCIEPRLARNIAEGEPEARKEPWAKNDLTSQEFLNVWDSNLRSSWAIAWGTLTERGEQRAVAMMAARRAEMPAPYEASRVEEQAIEVLEFLAECVESPHITGFSACSSTAAAFEDELGDSDEYPSSRDRVNLEKALEDMGCKAANWLTIKNGELAAKAAS